MTIDLDEVRARLSARGDLLRPAEVAEALAWLGQQAEAGNGGAG